MKKWCLVLIGLLSLYLSLAECKTSRRIYSAKKPSFHKPTKNPKNILDAFKGLPDDDVEFVKQLDKQFKKFGNNVKIKIQKENRTASAKNSKRTIEGSLGYGYYSQNLNDQRGSYSFSKPRLEYYPYSQHDIPPSPDYHQQQHYIHYLRHYPQATMGESDTQYYQQPLQQAPAHTSVEIQPSHSYEIKQTDTGYRAIIDDGHDDHQQQHNAVPVIVLRIPGPQKYASHLQALLQQYLELRAAQYIQALQEQETQGADHLQQQNDHDDGAYNEAPVVPYHAQQDESPQAYVAPIVQPQLNALHYATAAVGDFQPQDQQDQHDAHIETEQHVQTHSESPVDYYEQQQHQSHDDHITSVQPTSYEYHNIHDQQSHNNHGSHQEQIVYGAPHQESIPEHNHLLTAENYPSDKHTQVIFKSTTQVPYAQENQHPHEHEHEHEHHHYADAQVPADVQTYRAPLVYHKLEQYYNNPSYEPSHDDQNEHGGYDANSQQISLPQHAQHTDDNYVAITQRPALPYNYHSQLAQLAHYGEDIGFDYSTTPSIDDNGLYKRNSAKRQASSIQSQEDRYKKFAHVMQRMKSRMSSVKHTDGQAK